MALPWRAEVGNFQRADLGNFVSALDTLACLNADIASVADERRVATLLDLPTSVSPEPVVTGVTPRPSSQPPFGLAATNIADEFKVSLEAQTDAGSGRFAVVTGVNRTGRAMMHAFVELILNDSNGTEVNRGWVDFGSVGPGQTARRLVPMRTARTIKSDRQWAFYEELQPQQLNYFSPELTSRLNVFTGPRSLSTYSLVVAPDEDTVKLRWVTLQGDHVLCRYPGPSRLPYGAVMFTVGPPLSDVDWQKRQTINVADYDTLVLELKADIPGRAIKVGMKSSWDTSRPPTERRVLVSGITTEFREFSIPLSKLGSSISGPGDWRELVHVPLELVWERDFPASEISLRRVRFERQLP